MPSMAPLDPPDQQQRNAALDPARSILVRAPAGSGKTDLLTRRFLRLLAEVDDPAQVAAITFTKAAAAEMRHRILGELEKAAQGRLGGSDAFSMAALASRVLERSRTRNWNLLAVPSQLRISTIDSFCRELALQQPLLSGLAGGLEVAENPSDLYRRAARRTLRAIENENPSPRIAELQNAIEALLLWRDNNWRDLENQLVEMLGRRDQWMHDFVLDRAPDWDQLREQLEQPFARAALEAITRIEQLIERLPGACEEAIALARFACAQKELHRDLAELPDFPRGPHRTHEEIDTARRAHACLADLLLTVTDGRFRTRVTATEGFPAKAKAENTRMLAFLQRMRSVADLETALHSIRSTPPARYSQAEWEIVRACFTILRHAAAELKVLFAEAGRVDFTEVAQRAQAVLRDAGDTVSDAAMAEADKTRHLLVDEFQDTSRRQLKLLASLIEAWPDTHERSLFLVGDPMQSIYSFREADVELFLRVQKKGLELAGDAALPLDTVELTANFRAAPELTHRLNHSFETVFAEDDGSGVTFSSATAVRHPASAPEERMHLHLEFMPQMPRAVALDPVAQQKRNNCVQARKTAHTAQLQELVELIQNRSDQIQRAKAAGDKYRIAVLGRARKALAPVAAALRDAGIPFRAVDLETLSERPEVLDTLALARAFLLPEDRLAWLSVLRAPWCGLALPDLHRLTSGDDRTVLQKTVPELLAERCSQLTESGRRAANRVLAVWTDFASMRASFATGALGTLMEQVWLRLGGDACVDAGGRENVQLVWRSMDRLPSGGAGILNGELDAAIERLMAQPDPHADSDCGVQLMTIHKSKGLEFEVVIVPELQARSAGNGTRMLSWMERGIATPDAGSQITEFLVAPVGPKGGERTSTQKWVNDGIRLRETQEMRRLLYVAATRAREELHLFARPEYRTGHDGALTLCEPGAALLRTAWPALEQTVHDRFEEWKNRALEVELPALAAQAQILPMPERPRRAILRRLPDHFKVPELSSPEPSPQREFAALSGTPLYRRKEGGVASRALGRAVHRMLEEAARLCSRMDPVSAANALSAMSARAVSEARSSGVEPRQAQKLATEAVAIAARTLGDPVGQWILMPHDEAVSESSWTGVLDGVLRTVRTDRVFRAGELGNRNGNIWWVIDYKTTHSEDSNPAKRMEDLRPLYAPQLELYARFLRMLHGNAIELRAGLYYPRLLAFDWWKP